jgi:hypothetical protein
MSFAAKVGVGVRVAQLAGHHAADRIRPMRPARSGEVPRSVSALSSRWLTEALCSSTPGAAVTGFELSGTHEGTSSGRALTVEYNATGARAGLPVRLFTKTTPDLKTKLFTGLTNLFVGEANFYNLIRAGLDIECPVGFHASYELKRCRSMIILEDVARTRGATFGDPLTTSIDRAKAEDMVALMATYHAAFWESPRLNGEFGWLRSSPEWQRHLDSMINTSAMTRRGLSRAGSVLPPELARRAGEVWPAFVRSLDLKVRGPITLLHHDVHPSNWYVTGEGRMGLYDWQTLVKGIWAIDVSYALNSALTVEDRRAWLPDLLRLYLERLRAGGVAEPPGLEDAWTLYRQQTVHGLIFWLATLGAGALQPDLHPARRCLVNVERMAAAAVDLDTLGALDAARI